MPSLPEMLLMVCMVGAMNAWPARTACGADPTAAVHSSTARFVGAVEAGGVRPGAALAPALPESSATPGGAPAGTASGAPDSTLADSLLDAVGAWYPRRSVDYLWVLRSALTSRASIDSIVARARRMRVRGLLVQVVGRGDAFYRSDLLPRSPALRGREAQGLDPLGELVAGAHAAGLEVHAWMNCMLVWSAPWWPRDSGHVLNEHPEWVAQLKDGRPMTLLSPGERQRLRIEGIFLNPSHPRVRTWIARIAREIASRYPVDGIHLDYIRDPGIPVGYDPTSRARFALQTGIDPERFDDVPRERRASVDSAWTRFQRDQVTLTVREVRDSLRALRPGVALSAAVIADTARAERADQQCWRDWVRDSIVDRVYMMCYAPSVQTVMDQLLAMTRQFGPTDRVVPGIAVYNTSASLAALKIKGARTLGFPLVALYSYDSLYEKSAGWGPLKEHLEPAEP